MNRRQFVVGGTAVLAGCCVSASTSIAEASTLRRVSVLRFTCESASATTLGDYLTTVLEWWAVFDPAYTSVVKEIQTPKSRIVADNLVRKRYHLYFYINREEVNQDALSRELNPGDKVLIRKEHYRRRLAQS